MKNTVNKAIAEAIKGEMKDQYESPVTYLKELKQQQVKNIDFDGVKKRLTKVCLEDTVDAKNLQKVISTIQSCKTKMANLTLYKAIDKHQKEIDNLKKKKKSDQVGDVKESDASKIITEYNESL